MIATAKIQKQQEEKRIIPDGWRWVRLGEICKLVGGSTPDTSNSEYWNGELIWVTPTDLGKLSDMKISMTDRRITSAGLQSCGTEMLPIGTVVMSSRAPIGYLAIADVSLCTNQGCKSFVPGPEVDSVFMYWSLKQAVPDIQKLGSGATFTEVSKSALQQFEIPLPSLKEQKRIAGILCEQMVSVEKARAAAEGELKTINALPAALLRRAFSGEI
jgi:type I restriction enzyme S subunit